MEPPAVTAEEPTLLFDAAAMSVEDQGRCAWTVGYLIMLLPSEFLFIAR
jgi:hypothetical protein